MTTQSRYEVGTLGEITGFYSSFRSAVKYAVEGGYIYDRMAQIGKAQLWHVINGDLRVQSVRLANIGQETGAVLAGCGCEKVW